jgi:rhamnosyltransferase
MKQLNIAGSVILFNPKNEEINNISTYSHMLKKVYVFDNTENYNNKFLFDEYKNVVYYGGMENKGISKILNEACKKSIEDGFDYLLTMDQDSSFAEENLIEYFDSILNFENASNVSMFGLKFDENVIKLKKKNPNFEYKSELITSGSVVNLKLFNKIGGFDENLFIDGVDIDYCLNSISKGFLIVQFQNIYFKHCLGVPVEQASIFSLFLIKKKRIIHSYTRIYYMQRNSMYLTEKYKNINPELTDSFKFFYKKHISVCVKYSKNIFLAFYYKMNGIIDFYLNKMGKK